MAIKWRRFTCYVYGPSGLHSTHTASGRGLTAKAARVQCRTAFLEEPIGRDVRPKKPKFVLREEK